MSLANNMEGKFPPKILAFVTTITHNCDSFPCWSQIFHILPSICEGFILPSKIRFFETAFWVRQKFLVANRHFFCSVISTNNSCVGMAVKWGWIGVPSPFSVSFSRQGRSCRMGYDKLEVICYLNTKGDC